jgi:hypothetical protein
MRRLVSANETAGFSQWDSWFQSMRRLVSVSETAGFSQWDSWFQSMRRLVLVNETAGFSQWDGCLQSMRRLVSVNETAGFNHSVYGLLWMWCLTGFLTRCTNDASYTISEHVVSLHPIITPRCITSAVFTVVWDLRCYSSVHKESAFKGNSSNTRIAGSNPARGCCLVLS